MSKIKQIFLNTLREAPEDERAYNPAQDEEPLKQRLTSNELEPDAFDVEPGASNTGYKAEVAAAKQWIEEIDKFVKYLNDTATGSINRQVNVLDRDNSVFKGIASRISDKVARVSSDLAELKEIIAGFVIASDRKAKNIRMTDAFAHELTPLELTVEMLSRYGFEISSSTPTTHRLVLEADDGDLHAEVNEDGLVNGENVEEYLDRLEAEYNIEDLSEIEFIEEEACIDDKILQQIKEIDKSLAKEWNDELYQKRTSLLSKMQSNYIDVAKYKLGEG